MPTGRMRPPSTSLLRILLPPKHRLPWNDKRLPPLSAALPPEVCAREVGRESQEHPTLLNCLERGREALCGILSAAEGPVAEAARSTARLIPSICPGCPGEDRTRNRVWEFQIPFLTLWLLLCIGSLSLAKAFT